MVAEVRPGMAEIQAGLLNEIGMFRQFGGALVRFGSELLASDAVRNLLRDTPQLRKILGVVSRAARCLRKSLQREPGRCGLARIGFIQQPDGVDPNTAVLD